MINFVAAFSSMTPSTYRLLMLGASAFLLYGAGRLIMGAVPARADRAGLRALLGSGVVLAVTLVAVFAGRGDLGLHLPVACALAATTFGFAALILGRPLPGGAIGNRSWALIAPAVVIALVGGFGGRLDWPMLGSLVGYGVAAMLSWREVEDEGTDRPPRGAPTTLALVLWIGGIALSALAAVLVMLGMPALEAGGMRADALAVSFLLAPAIVVPIFFELLPPCRGLGWNASASTLVKFALINLCFVLPIVSLVQADAGVIRNLWAAGVSATAAPTRATSSLTTQPTTNVAVTRPAEDVTATPELVFATLPAPALRIDLLVLAGALLILIPLAAGWQRPSMIEAGALMACYLLALLLMMLSVWRR